MKILIENFGPIKSFRFDLSKDLNIIFGKNNIGKSYAITAVYILIKNLLSDFNSSRMLNEMDFLFYSEFSFRHIENKQINELREVISEKQNKVVSSLKNKNTNTLEVTTELESIFSRLISISVIPNIERSLDNSFTSITELRNKFSGEKLKIHLFFADLNFVIGTDQNSKLCITELKFTKSIFVKRSTSNRKPHTSGNKTFLYYNYKTSSKNSILITNYIPNIYRRFRSEINEYIKNIYFLPASRSGLYQALSTFSAVIAELSKSRNFLTKKIELPNISEPVSDYFLYLSNISKPNLNNQYSTITKYIEKSILNGEVRFDFDSQKIVFYSTKINSELDLSVTSSMISEIAPIVAYLKFIISDRSQQYLYFRYKEDKKRSTASNVIFIEEPEAHLHPEVQVLLMKTFVELTKLNVKIIMTTHSNYMFNKLSNLILDKSISYKKVGSYLMKMTEKGSVVDEIAMQAGDEGIMDENFVDISEKLYEERQNIYSKKK